MAFVISSSSVGIRCPWLSPSNQSSLLRPVRQPRRSPPHSRPCSHKPSIALADSTPKASQSAPFDLSEASSDPVSWADFIDPDTLSADGGGLPLPDFEKVPTESRGVASQIWPLDGYNTELLDNVHPAKWEDASAGATGPLEYDVVVIGAGPGGLVTASGAAGVAAKVALVEASLLGGDCLNIGCVPSKALLHSANLAHTLRGDMARLEENGISIEGGAAAVKVDFAKTMERLRRLRAQLSEADSAERYKKKLGVDVFLGYAKFASERSVVVNGRELRFKKAVIATGTSPSLIPMPGLKELFEQAGSTKGGQIRPAVMTNETFFNLTAQPKHLVIFGAGAVGMELGQAMQRLGSQVTILARSGEVLAKEDPDVAQMVKYQMQKDGVSFRLEIAKNKSIGLTGTVLGNGLPELTLDLEEKDHAGTGNGTRSFELTCDAVLVATGRKPNVTGMDLEKAGITFDAKAGLTVDDRLQTSNPRVYGVGNCCSAFKFTHAADFMARTVIRNALFFGNGEMSSLLIPWATYTSPEIASVGLYPRDLKERGIAYDIYEKRFSSNDRSICDGATTGMVRLRADVSGKILGATVCGAGAGNMISEITLAMQSGTKLGDLASVIHPYPTTAESIRQAGDTYNLGKLTPFVRFLLWGVIKVQR